ncbi:MAG TPA: DMT family transporter [Protaetiibacter sp.]|nr:DMT family transporter [Protaetiibacter sp.]
MTHEHAQRPLVRAAATLAALVMGGFMALQPRVNGQLGAELDDGLLAAFYSFGSGTVALALALVVWSPGRRGLGLLGDAIRDKRMTPWFLIGGFAGALMVLSQGLTAALLGVAVFTVALVGGQTLGSLLVDRYGVGTMLPTPLTPPRLVGAALAVAAVVWAVSDRLNGDIPWWMLALPFVAGMFTSWQAAANAQLRVHARSVLSATFVSFLAGTLVLAIASAIRIGAVGFPQSLPSEPWLYSGGLLGIVFIAGSTAIVPVTGVLVYGLATIAGQLLVAVLLDLVFPVAGSGLSVATVGGAALAVIAVAIASFRRPPRRHAVTAGSGAPAG